MTKRTTAGLAAAALLIGTLACAGTGLPREEDTGAAPDTSGVQNPPGYRGMERDTTQVPADSQPAPVDTFLQEQGTGTPTDTAGFGGLERDTSGAGVQDTTGAGMTDTTGTTGVDTSGTTGVDTTGTTGVDTSGMIDTSGQTGLDTTGQQ
jgi:hypothetical protein